MLKSKEIQVEMLTIAGSAEMANDEQQGVSLSIIANSLDYSLPSVDQEEEKFQEALNESLTKAAEQTEEMQSEVKEFYDSQLHSLKEQLNAVGTALQLTQENDQNDQQALDHSQLVFDERLMRELEAIINFVQAWEVPVEEIY
jgi:hypothetical protein